MILGHDTKQNERLRQISRELGFYGQNMSEVKGFITAYTNISKTQNWEQMSLSTAQGAAAVDASHYGVCFDGRYVYYVAYSSDTFLRYDTTLLFSAAASWSQMSMSTAIGAMVDAAFYQSAFDGRYVYFCPYNADSFVRYDTKASFVTDASWEKINMSTAQVGATLDAAYGGCGFDGRYIYFSPVNSDSFIRFDTTLLFTNSSAWERVAMSTVQGGSPVDDGYFGVVFDGRYVYFIPNASDSFLRFDSTLSFTNSSAWEQMAMSTAVRGSALDNAFIGGCFDGRYVYYTPFSCTTHVRFDTTRNFTNSNAWEIIMKSTVFGAAVANFDFITNCFDGRYVYYCPCDANTFIRYDTTALFTYSVWDKSAMSSAQGATELDSAYTGSCFDGRYVYFCPFNSDTLIRVLACSDKEVRS